MVNSISYFVFRNKSIKNKATIYDLRNTNYALCAGGVKC